MWVAPFSVRAETLRAGRAAAEFDGRMYRSGIPLVSTVSGPVQSPVSVVSAVTTPQAGGGSALDVPANNTTRLSPRRMPKPSCALVPPSAENRPLPPSLSQERGTDLPGGATPPLGPTWWRPADGPAIVAW